MSLSLREPALINAAIGPHHSPYAISLASYEIALVPPALPVLLFASSSVLRQGWHMRLLLFLLLILLMVLCFVAVFRRAYCLVLVVVLGGLCGGVVVMVQFEDESGAVRLNGERDDLAGGLWS
jgi:hypothetical protein